MSFSITLRVFSVLCLAVISVAGQWSGSYNRTYVEPNTVPPLECRIKNLARAIHPCVCTGGKVFPGCSLWQSSAIYNSVRDANCKCVPPGYRGYQTGSLNAYGRGPNGKTEPGVVRECICDPVASTGDNSTDELVVPAPNCWCPASWLQSHSGLSEATESQAAPEIPPSVAGQCTRKQTELSESKESQAVPETPSSVDKQSTTQQPGQKQPATRSVQWIGNYNTTSLAASDDPPRGCELESRLARTILAPCVCTGGNVIASCNWQSIHGSYNTVRDANCKCQRAPAGSTWQDAKDLVAYGLDSNGRNLPGAVRGCGCDPAPGKGDDKPDELGLVVPGPNCLCPTRNLAEYSGLSEAEESQATQQPGEQQVPTGSFQRCRDDLNKGKFRHNILCKQLMEAKPKELPQQMQSVLPNCSTSSLIDICKDIPQA